MSVNDANRKCAIVIIADGFREVEAIGMLNTLRWAGVYAKSVGLTSGLVKGARGILVRPDLTLADLSDFLEGIGIALVVLPGGERNLSRLAQDPRVHELVRDVALSHGIIATNPSGMRIVQSALGPGMDMEREDDYQIALHYDPDQPIETFAEDLIRRLA